MPVYFHAHQNWMTATSSEELGTVAFRLNVKPNAMHDGYCELTPSQRARASYYGGTVNNEAFMKLVGELTREVEI